MHAGHTSKGPKKDYSIKGNSEDRIFGVFNAIAIIATTFGNGIIPEIQVCNSSPKLSYTLGLSSLVWAEITKG